MIINDPLLLDKSYSNGSILLNASYQINNPLLLSLKHEYLCRDLHLANLYPMGNLIKSNNFDNYK